MNEFVFLLHSFIIILFSLIAFRLGKEALICSILIQTLLENLFIIKQASLFGFKVTCTDAFAVGNILSINLLQEFFGKKESRKAIVISFLFLAFFFIMSKIHMLYKPNSFDNANNSYSIILSYSNRVIAASVFTFFITQQFDIWFFSMLKNKFLTLSFYLRNGLSLLVSSFLDTIIFTFLALYGTVKSPMNIITVSFFIKAIAIMPIFLIFKFKTNYKTKTE